MRAKSLSVAAAVASLATGCAISVDHRPRRNLNQVSLGYPTPAGPREVLRPNTPMSPPVIVPGTTGFYSAVWPDYRLRFCCGVAGTPQISPDGTIALEGSPFETLNTLSPEPWQPFVMSLRLQQFVRIGRGVAVFDRGDAWLRTPGANVREIAEHRTPNLPAGNRVARRRDSPDAVRRDPHGRRRPVVAPRAVRCKCLLFATAVRGNHVPRDWSPTRHRGDRRAGSTR